jgi:hypothetical protein
MGRIMTSQAQAMSADSTDLSAERVSADGVDLENFDVENAAAQESVSENPESEDRSITAVKDLVTGDDRVSKKDLVQLLEGFVNILRTDSTNLPAPLNANSSPSTGVALMQDVQVNDRTAEIESLRNLVIEAQDTIIKLLTDRVEDRARIAGLETQLNILPDLQAQADRAMMVAVKTEDYRSELTKIKFELDRFRLHRVRSEVEQKKGTIWKKIQRWLFVQRRTTSDDAVKPTTEMVSAD